MSKNPLTVSVLASVLAPLVAALLAQAATARDRSPTCSELVWSAQMLAANPDIENACLGVYRKGSNFYAKVTIEVTAIRGNRLTFKTIHKNGSPGGTRSIVVDKNWRATIDGRPYRANQLETGQQLSVYIPEDRFALAMDNGDFAGDESLIDIEDAEVVEMPK
jgi:hypothetical protein